MKLDVIRIRGYEVQEHSATMPAEQGDGNAEGEINEITGLLSDSSFYPVAGARHSFPTPSGRPSDFTISNVHITSPSSQVRLDKATSKVTDAIKQWVEGQCGAGQ